MALKPRQAKGISLLQGLTFCVRIIAFSQLHVKWTYCIIQRDSTSRREMAPYQLLKTGKFHQLKGIPFNDLWGRLFSAPAVPLHSRVRWLSRKEVDDFFAQCLDSEMRSLPSWKVAQCPLLLLSNPNCLDGLAKADVVQDNHVPFVARNRIETFWQITPGWAIVPCLWLSKLISWRRDTEH